MEIYIAKAKLTYPYIYSGVSFDTSPVRYGATFTVDCAETAQLLSSQGVFPGMNGFVARSAKKPIITDIRGNYDDVDIAWQRADIRNISRDMLLRHLDVSLYVEPYSYNASGARGVALSLLEIVIDSDILKNKALSYERTL